MTIEQTVFNKAIINLKTLIPYGFKKEKDIYVYKKTFLNNEFKAIIQVAPNGTLTGNVYEVETNDIYYPLRVEEMFMGFAEQVRMAYRQILEDIKNHCCQKTYFEGAQANRLTQHIIKYYGDYPDFPWPKYNGYGVFRNRNNKKWYALIMNISKSKVDKNKTGNTDAVNLKIDNKKIPELTKQTGIYPAYHMNKNNWITVLLDDTVADTTILSLIDESYGFTLNKRPKTDTPVEWLIPANPKYFDVIDAFNKNDEIIWKQSSDVKIGDTAYLYVGAPYSAILYKCQITATDIPYKYADANLKITRVMKIKKIKQYDKSLATFTTLKQFGLKAVRGPRFMPDTISKWLNQK